MSEPVVRSEQLRELVELAKAQPAPAVSVTVEDVWRRRDEHGGNRTWWVAGGLAAAAGLLMQKDSGIPAVWVEGVAPEGEGSVKETLRDSATDLFR